MRGLSSLVVLLLLRVEHKHRCLTLVLNHAMVALAKSASQHTPTDNYAVIKMTLIPHAACLILYYLLAKVVSLLLCDVSET